LIDISLQRQELATSADLLPRE